MDHDNNVPTILIVDDDMDVLELLEETISIMANYRLILAKSGTEALEMIEKDPPDLVLLDIMMKDIDGTDVCRAIKSNVKSSHIPVIALTVIHKNHKERYEQILASGVDEYVEKPYEFDNLKEIICDQLKVSDP